jgi:hypothetical protein
MKLNKYVLFVAIVALIVCALVAFIPIKVQAAPVSPPTTGQHMLMLAASQGQAAPIDILNAFGRVMASFLSLVGVAGLVAILVNIGKVSKIVKDGTAGQWTAGLNLLCFIALVILGVFRPDIELNYIDGIAGQITAILVFILGFVIQVVGSKPIYELLKSAEVPLLGKSFSPPEKK